MSRIQKYILGLLSPSRAEAFEKAFLGNYKLAQQLEEKTEQLLDAYVERRLTPAESQQVKQRLGQLPGLQARVHEKQLFLDFIARQPRVVMVTASPVSYRIKWGVALLAIASVTLLFFLIGYQKLHPKEPQEIVKVPPEIRPLEPAGEVPINEASPTITKTEPRKSKPTVKAELLTNILLLPTVLRAETDITILTASPGRKIRADLVVGEAGNYTVTLALRSGEMIEKAHRIQTRSFQKKRFLPFVLPKHLQAGKYEIKAENANERLLYSFEVK